mmetsp:Transcript_111673/g.238538  ORF Transcript_111673/g.238538 Transcript_111673/m.238538 type:complete len:296 (+) Transcript_111673:477-1364(+)
MVGLQLPGVFIGRLAQGGLEALEAFLHRGVVRLPGLPLLCCELAEAALMRLGLACQLGMGRLDAVQLSGVFVRRAALHRFQVVHALLQGGLVSSHACLLVGETCMCLLQVTASGLAGREAAMEAVKLGVGLCKVLSVPAAGIAEGLLEGIEALRHGGMLRMCCFDSLQLLRMLGVRILEVIQRHGVLLSRVTEHALDVDHALLERSLLAREAGVSPLEVANGGTMSLARCNAAVHGIELGVRRGKLPGVLVCRLPEGLLEICETLCKKCVMSMGCFYSFQLLHVLGMGVLDSRES